MSTMTVTVNVTNPDAEDRRAMDYIIGLENTRRAELVPPGTPLVNVDGPTRKTSFETCLSQVMAVAIPSYIKQANDSALNDPNFTDLKPLWKDATPAKKAAALAALQ